jgi:hypothetical protein
VKQSLSNLFTGVHWDDQKPRLCWVTELSVTSCLSRAIPSIGFQNFQQFLRSHLAGFLAPLFDLFQCSNHGQLNMFGERAGLAVQVVFELFAELLHKAKRGHGCCVAQWAEGAAHHVFREVLNVVDIFGNAEAGVETGERFFEPVRTFAAGDAPAAGLVLIEADSAESEFDYTGLVVDDDDAA